MRVRAFQMTQQINVLSKIFGKFMRRVGHRTFLSIYDPKLPRQTDAHFDPDQKGGRRCVYLGNLWRPPQKTAIDKQATSGQL
jgi:hypothetical protein